MRQWLGLLLVWGGLLPISWAQQATWTLFEGTAGAAYEAASVGTFSGGDTLILSGPESRNLPLFRLPDGRTGARLVFQHVAGGFWQLTLYRPEGLIDLQTADTLRLLLNAPAALPGVWLPELALIDQEGRTTATVAIRAGTEIGWNALRSGWLPGSQTDLTWSVRYVPALPAELPRLGYPEDLWITFADAPIDTSQPAIGLPARPARFMVQTFSGDKLPFRYQELDGDQTLSAIGEYIEVLTPEPETGRLRPTWRIEVARTSLRPPILGDRYLLAVDNDGIDSDPNSWQVFRIAWSDFGPPGRFDPTRVAGFRLQNSAMPTQGLRTLWIGRVEAVDHDPEGTPPPMPQDVQAVAGDSSVVLYWEPVAGAVRYRIYRQDHAEAPFHLLAEVVPPEDYADLQVRNEQTYTYVVRSVDAQGRVSPDSAPVQATPVAGLEDAFLDLVQRRAFAYFWQEANPNNGLIRDRSRPESPASIAAVGFGLSALTVGIDRGWISREEGRTRILRTLEFFWNAPQNPNPDATGYQGFFYHFLDMQSGRRVWQSELSTIDTALLMAGVLHVRQYFDGQELEEVRIRALADSLYRRVRWRWFAPRMPLLALGWTPETGFLLYDWRGYNEAMILYLLALGAPADSLPAEAWQAWTQTYRWATHYGYSFVEFPPLFGHQYSHVWIDFRGIQDAYMREKGIDYFENSRRATLAQQAYHRANPNRYPNYGADEWGLTASDVPGGYLARGAPPPQNDEGTLAPTAPAGSIPFTPEVSVWTLRTLYRRYRNRLWGPYGFRDAYNVQQNWFATDYLGIDQGPIVLMIENFRTGAIWRRMMTHEAVVQGLARAGFRPVSTAAHPPALYSPKVLRCFPNPFTQYVEVQYVGEEVARLRVNVYDVLGRIVATYAPQRQASGLQHMVLEAMHWPTGPLFLEIDGESTRASCLIVHLKP